MSDKDVFAKFEAPDEAVVVWKEKEDDGDITILPNDVNETNDNNVFLKKDIDTEDDNLVIINKK